MVGGKAESVEVWSRARWEKFKMPPPSTRPPTGSNQGRNPSPPPNNPRQPSSTQPLGGGIMQPGRNPNSAQQGANMANLQGMQQGAMVNQQMGMAATRMGAMGSMMRNNPFTLSGRLKINNTYGKGIMGTNVNNHLSNRVPSPLRRYPFPNRVKPVTYARINILGFKTFGATLPAANTNTMPSLPNNPFQGGLGGMGTGGLVLGTVFQDKCVQIPTQPR